MTGHPHERPTLGIGLRIMSGLLFAAMVVCIKAVSLDVPLGQVVFFRSAFALVPLVIFLMLRREFPGGLRTQRPFGHMLRSGFGALAMFASFASVARLPMAEASLISHLEPPRVYRRVKHSKDEPYDKESTYPRLSGRTA